MYTNSVKALRLSLNFWATFAPLVWLLNFVCIIFKLCGFTYIQIHTNDSAFAFLFELLVLQYIRKQDIICFSCYAMVILAHTIYNMILDSPARIQTLLILLVRDVILFKKKKKKCVRVRYYSVVELETRIFVENCYQ